MWTAIETNTLKLIAFQDKEVFQNKGKYEAALKILLI